MVENAERVEKFVKGWEMKEKRKNRWESLKCFIGLVGVVFRGKTVQYFFKRPLINHSTFEGS